MFSFNEYSLHPYAIFLLIGKNGRTISKKSMKEFVKYLGVSLDSELLPKSEPQLSI